ncbi:MAG: hypothetical protein WC753_04645 [Candidatus Gracilibacteria bacterium]
MLEIKDPCDEIFSALRTVNEEQAAFIVSLRDKANEILELLNELPNSRRKSIAITKLEECVLFANKTATYGA